VVKPSPLFLQRLDIEMPPVIADGIFVFKTQKTLTPQ